MREVYIYKHPVTEPGFCGKCGSQNRDWFVDIGFDTIFNHPEAGEGVPNWTDGTIYICSECYHNLVSDVNRRFESFLNDVQSTRRGYTLPVGLEEKLLPLVESKYPREWEEFDGEDEPGIESDDLDGSDPGPLEIDGEDDGQSESDDFGFRITVESPEFVDG